MPEGVDVTALDGIVGLYVSSFGGNSIRHLSSDEARLVGLRLIKLADRAEDEE